MRNHCHCQWRKPTVFTITAGCRTKNWAAQLRGQGLCCILILAAVIPPRHYLRTTELTAQCASRLQVLQVPAFPTGDAKVHLCCLGYFVVASLGGCRRSVLAWHANAAMCGVLLNVSLSGGLQNCKMAKGLLPGNKCAAHSSVTRGRLWKSLSGEEMTPEKWLSTKVIPLWGSPWHGS